jgi:hypothetical protein
VVETLTLESDPTAAKAREPAKDRKERRVGYFIPCRLREEADADEDPDDEEEADDDGGGV